MIRVRCGKWSSFHCVEPSDDNKQTEKGRNIMQLHIQDNFGEQVTLQPRVELYSVRDYMGQEMPGLAIVLDQVGANPNELEQYAVLTVSFGEFIGPRDCAYIDTNNCPFAKQLLDQGIAKDTGFTKNSGFCEYPLWVFKREFLEQIGGENYQVYAQNHEAYTQAMREALDGPEDSGPSQSGMTM